MPTRKKATPVLPEFTHLRVRVRAVSLGSHQFNTGDLVDVTDVDEETSDIGLRQLNGVKVALAQRGNNHPPVEAGNLDKDDKFVPVQVGTIALERTAEEWDVYSPEAQKLKQSAEDG